MTLVNRQICRSGTVHIHFVYEPRLTKRTQLANETMSAAATYCFNRGRVFATFSNNGNCAIVVLSRRLGHYDLLGRPLLGCPHLVDGQGRQLKRHARRLESAYKCVSSDGTSRHPVEMPRYNLCDRANRGRNSAAIFSPRCILYSMDGSLRFAWGVFGTTPWIIVVQNELLSIGAVWRFAKLSKLTGRSSGWI